MTKRYTYADMPDKTKNGIYSEVKRGLALIAFHGITTLGIPKEMMQDYFSDTIDPLSNAEKMAIYFRYRNEYPSFFEKHMVELSAN